MTPSRAMNFPGQPTVEQMGFKQLPVQYGSLSNSQILALSHTLEQISHLKYGPM